MKNARIRYTKRNRRNLENGGTIKKAVLRQCAVCGVAFALIFLLKDTFFEKNGLAYKISGVILTENTDFAQKWQDIKTFFSEQIKVTNLLISDKDLDPVKNMISPVKGEIYQKFGIQSNNDGTESFCYGVKIKTDQSAKIQAIQNGEIAETGYNDAWGNYILIKHSEKIYSFYAYLGEILLSTGEKVKKGQVIASSELNLNDGVNMIYFEIRDGDSTLDPEAFIDFSLNGDSAS